MLKHLKVKVGRIYINYFFWPALWLSIPTLLYGSFIILSAKGESSSILANFGSFSGGMTTVVAALVAVREFILFRHNQGVKEFREFFSKQVQSLPNFVLEMTDEAYLLFAKLDRKAKDDLKRPEVIHEIQELENKLKLFEEDVSSRYHQLRAEAADIFSMSTYLEILIGTKTKRLLSILEELKGAIHNYELRADFYINTASKMRSSEIKCDYEVNNKNEFISHYSGLDYKRKGSLFHRMPKLLGAKRDSIIGEVFKIYEELEKLKIT
ncbi:hypothetical protein [Pseudoalteromonas rhizosphaerae]|uniref:hypothetical protein n=1 Tax=Pseudoalteromonas rhizosphaerae TaxID=2518973 RepID=UPI00123039E4|nr:hypothetical protein [Pseudoalteromonas rhizosphaerae]